ncbi:MAG: hypothetical protein K2J81_02965 [Treponemataceae bacterium]|nr:hypothetical protein [Treponemataceae bacterium]
MKALVVADSDTVIEHVGSVLKTAGYDIITYRTLLKAFDNFEEIAPHLIVISTEAYPRHWKTLAQYATVPLGAYKPQVILYTGGTLDEEEQKKAAALHIRGCFSAIDVKGLDELRRILAEKDDIFSGSLNDPVSAVKPIEIPDDFAEAHAQDEQVLEEFVEEEVSRPGESLEEIGQQIETEVVRAASPLEAAAATEDDEEDVEEPEELADEQPQSTGISIEDILRQNQSFNRFAEIPVVKTEAEAKRGDTTYEFVDVKGLRYDEAVSVSSDEMSSLKHVEPETEHPALADAATDDVQDVQEILSQNQQTDGDLSWLAGEHADEPELLATDAVFDDNSEPVGMSASEADDAMGAILVQNQFSMKHQIDWLAMEIADEPEPLEPVLDDIADPTGNEAQKVAESMDAILAQNQTTDTALDWLAEETADEPELPSVNADFDDNTEPVGISASECDANVQDIVTQNQGIADGLAADQESLQPLVDKMNGNCSPACGLVLTNPETGVLISGLVRNITGDQLEFTPDIPSLAKNFKDGMAIDSASIQTDGGIEAATVTVVSAAEPMIVAISCHGN